MNIEKELNSKVYAAETIENLVGTELGKVIYLKKDIEEIEKSLYYIEFRNNKVTEELLDEVQKGITHIEQKRRKLENMRQKILNEQVAFDEENLIIKYDNRVENILEKSIMFSEEFLKTYRQNDIEDF